MRRIVAALIGLMLLGSLLWAGFEVARAVAPARLHAEVEGLLAEATQAPVEIAEVRFVWGFPLRLEGRGLRLWDGALRIEQAKARLDVLSLLIGRPRLVRLRLDGAELHVTQRADGTWQPPIVSEGPPGPAAEALLVPFQQVQGLARFLLARPLLADMLVVRNGALSVSRADPRGGPPSVLRFEGLQGLLRHSRLRGDASLELSGRWMEGNAVRAALDWQGSRERGGRVELRLRASDLDLAVLGPELRGLVPGLTLRGRLDGAAEIDSAEPGSARLVLALTARDVEAQGGETEEASAPLRVPRVAAQLRFALDPDRLAISNGRVEVGEWVFELDGDLARPLGPRAQTRARIALGGLRLDPEVIRTLTGWLPPEVRERTRAVMGQVREGRLARGELSGEAPLAQWGDAFSGRPDALLPALKIGAQLEGVRIALDEASELADVTGQVDWSAGTLEVHGGRANLDGQPLPELELRFGGLARLLATGQQDRLVHSSAQALVGLTPLYAVLSPPTGEPSPPPPAITLDLEQVQHRALLWPLRSVHADVEPRENSVFMVIRKALWAGVPVQGDVDLTLRPERRLAVRLETTPDAVAAGGDAAAGSAADPAVAVSAVTAEPAGQEPWATGWIDIGPSRSGFQQRHTRARVRAVGAEVRFDDVVCELEPTGRIEGSLELDLSREDAVPYALRAELRDGDVAALIAQRGYAGDFATGRVALAGHLSGTLVPGQPLLHDVSGALTLAGRDGTIRKTVPPIFALALASDAMNPFARREHIRFERVDSQLAFENGMVSTDALELEGPDLRMFGSGRIELGAAPHKLRAEIALFLFRQLDWALVKIPILSDLLLGENQNLVAAYFKLVGTWEDPEAKAQPLRTLQETAGGDLIEGIPRVVSQGMKAIGALLRPVTPAAPVAPAPSRAGAPAPPETAAPAPAVAPPAPETTAPDASAAPAPSGAGAPGAPAPPAGS